MTEVLALRGLNIRFPMLHAVRDVSLSIEAGLTHCLVGESGSGKSMTALSIMGLLPRSAVRTAATLSFAGEPIGGFGERQMARLRGDRMAMVFQEPMTSLNPAYTIGSQLTEVLRRHRRMPREAAVTRAVEMLARVGVNAPDMRMGQFPHQLSGGLRQRVMIAMALLCDPQLLIADEPTTALDVTVQAQILRLLVELQRELGLAVLFITHDLGVVARIAHRVSVMYAGEVVEEAPASELFAQPTHPYTRGLLAAIPVPGKVRRGERLGSIPGVAPPVGPGFVGCAFRYRCAQATAACETAAPQRRVNAVHAYRCRLPPGWQEAA